jgi:hypothetical protein
MKSIQPLSGAGMLLVASGLLHGQMVDPQSPDLTFGPPPFESDSEDQLFFDNPIALSTGDDLFTDTVADDAITPHYAMWFGYEYMLADYDLTGDAAKYWTGDPASVGRIQSGVEGPEGYGIRLQSWSFENNSRHDLGPLEVRVATLFLDGYRRFTGERGELLLGGGLAFGSLKIDSPVEDSVLRFNGLGASLAGEGFYSLLRLGKTDFGVTGRARLALLGPLQDNFGDSQAMLVDELGIGLELRRRFGKREDKMFFVRLGREYQHWSDIESPLAFDQNVQGTSLTIGMTW